MRGFPAGSALTNLAAFKQITGGVGGTSDAFTTTVADTLLLSIVTGQEQPSTPGAGYTEAADIGWVAVSSKEVSAIQTGVTSSYTQTGGYNHAAITTLVLTTTAPAGDTTAPTITGPTGTGGTLTGTGGITSNEAGTHYWQATTSATPLTIPTAPAAMTGWTSRSLTATAQTWSLSTLAAGTYYVHNAAEDAAGNRTTTDVVSGSFVVTATPATARPASDVTTAGWTASTGTNFAALLDEVSPSDADFITSPPLSGSTAPVTVALDTVLIAGSWTIGVRARTTSGAGTVRVYLLNDAGTVVGTSGLQAITSTFATYSLPVTTSGIATRARIETLSS